MAYRRLPPSVGSLLEFAQLLRACSGFFVEELSLRRRQKKSKMIYLLNVIKHTIQLHPNYITNALHVYNNNIILTKSKEYPI